MKRIWTVSTFNLKKNLWKNWNKKNYASPFINIFYIQTNTYKICIQSLLDTLETPTQLVCWMWRIWVRVLIMSMEAWLPHYRGEQALCKDNSNWPAVLQLWPPEFFKTPPTFTIWTCKSRQNSKQALRTRSCVLRIFSYS